MGANVLIRAPGQKVRIYLGGFFGNELRAVIRYFRETFPEDIQTGWQKYAAVFGHRPIPVPPTTTRRQYVFLAFFWLSLTGFGYGAWRAGYGTGNLVAAVVSVAGAVWCLWRCLRVRRLDPAGG